MVLGIKNSVGGITGREIYWPGVSWRAKIMRFKTLKSCTFGYKSVELATNYPSPYKYMIYFYIADTTENGIAAFQDICTFKCKIFYLNLK